MYRVGKMYVFYQSHRLIYDCIKVLYHSFYHTIASTMCSINRYLYYICPKYMLINFILFQNNMELIIMMMYILNLRVRQGKNLTQFLFSIYINDTESFMIDRNITGFLVLQMIKKTICLLSFLFLFKQKTLLLSESTPDIQQAFD